ncbi:MAG: SUMF1/EgtB/PvdO family nonheme iron enzyme [Candidatus Eisenbacteria bacterium]|nr:SUMF1/EgtB/PvdO family nonheme iron enzyme [Candidatus Eisenbacteria bacterium]
MPLSEGLTAADKVTRTFSIPGFYEPKLEAFNTYYPGPGAATQELEVTNVGGRPRPQSEMIRIESGTYTIGAIDSAQADTDELGIHTVDVNTFYIEKNEVTTTLYSKYLNAARDSAAIIFTPPGTVSDTLGNVLINFNESKVRYAVDPSIDSFYVAPGFENHPVTGVSWYGARAYSIFYGLRLPTEREWEIAARGDSLQWLYPWGREFDYARCNVLDSGDPYESEEPYTTPVGFYDGMVHEGYQTLDGSSYHDLNDMSGNVKEWVRDWYESTYHTSPPPNYPGPPSGTYKVMRGGSNASIPGAVRSTNREATDPNTKSSRIGFRTAYTLFEE